MLEQLQEAADELAHLNDYTNTDVYWVVSADVGFGHEFIILECNNEQECVAHLPALRCKFPETIFKISKMAQDDENNNKILEEITYDPKWLEDIKQL